MRRIQRSRVETVSGLALFCQILIAESQRRHVVLRGEIHECCQWRLAKFRSASQGDLIFTIKFECQQASRFLRKVRLLEICCLQKCRGQLHAYRLHTSKLTYPSQFVIRFPRTPDLHRPASLHLIFRRGILTMENLCMTADTNTHSAQVANRASFPSKPCPRDPPNNPNSHPILQAPLELSIDSHDHLETVLTYSKQWPVPFWDRHSKRLFSDPHPIAHALRVPLDACARMGLLA